MPPYPQSSTHLRNWIFQEQQLSEQRRKVNEAAAASVRVSITPPPPDELLLSWEEELMLVEYFSRQFLVIAQNKELHYQPKNTTLSFFRRFFLFRSVHVYDPRIIMFTCLLLALKCEEESRQMSLKFLFEGAGALNLSEIFHNELHVLDAIYYELQILDVKTPLQYVCDGYYTTHRKGWASSQSKASSSTPTAESGEVPVVSDLNPSTQLEQLLRSVHCQAEAMSLKVYDTDIPLLFTPSQIASALFVHFSRGQLHGADKFVLKIFSKDAEAYETAISKLQDLQARLLMYESEAAVRMRDSATTVETIKNLLGRIDKLRKLQRKSQKKTTKSKGPRNPSSSSRAQLATQSQPSTDGEAPNSQNVKSANTGDTGTSQSSIDTPTDVSLPGSRAPSLPRSSPQEDASSVMGDSVGAMSSTAVSLAASPSSPPPSSSRGVSSGGGVLTLTRTETSDSDHVVTADLPSVIPASPSYPSSTSLSLSSVGVGKRKREDDGDD